MEQPLSCFQSSPDCSVNETSLPYSQCCASGTEHFMINDTCYGFAGENHYNVYMHLATTCIIYIFLAMHSQCYLCYA